MRAIGAMMCGALAALALAAGPVVAQTPNVNLIPELKSKSAEEKEQDAIRDKAYRESLKKIPDAKASNDPWGGMRSDPPKQAAPKASAATTSAPKKTKTGTAAN